MNIVPTCHATLTPHSCDRSSVYSIVSDEWLMDTMPEITAFLLDELHLSKVDRCTIIIVAH